MAIPAILIEDSVTIRRELEATLAELTQVQIVATVDTAQAGLEVLKIHSEWRLAIVDLFLKTGSGLEVLRGCQIRQPGQKVVVLSNYATPDIRERCLALGADGVFDKSTELEDFIDFCAALREG